MCQIRLRGSPPGLQLIRAIMEFHANKLSRQTVTGQWFGSTSVTWAWRASSLSGPIMRKWSFAIELCNGKYWLVPTLIGWFNCVIGLWAYRVASNCGVVICIVIHSLDFLSTFQIQFLKHTTCWHIFGFETWLSCKATQNSSRIMRIPGKWILLLILQFSLHIICARSLTLSNLFSLWQVLKHYCHDRTMGLNPNAQLRRRCSKSKFNDKKAVNENHSW